MPKVNQTSMVYEKLKERIERGYYSPSESLPEIELATEYGVSRNTIKKSLLMLEKDSYVTIEPNKGAKVRNYSKSEVLDYLEIRVELEGFIVRLAVPEISASDIKCLEELYAQMEQYQNEHNLLGCSQLNQKFHAAVYDACPNKAATELLLRLKNQMRKYNAKTILVPGRAEASLQEHRALLDAIKERDIPKAEHYARLHVENVRKTYEEYYALLF